MVCRANCAVAAKGAPSKRLTASNIRMLQHMDTNLRVRKVVLFSYLYCDVAIATYRCGMLLTRYRWQICWWCLRFVAKRFFQGSTVADSCAEAFWMLVSNFCWTCLPVCESFFCGFCLDFLMILWLFQDSLFVRVDVCEFMGFIFLKSLGAVDV